MIENCVDKHLMELEGAIILYKVTIPVNEFFEGLCEAAKKVLITHEQDILVASYDHPTGSD